MIIITKKVIDFFDWLDSDNSSLSRASTKKKKDIYRMSKKAISKYFCDRGTIRKSLEKMTTFDLYELHIASVELHVFVDEDPFKTISTLSFPISLVALTISGIGTKGTKKFLIPSLILYVAFSTILSLFHAFSNASKKGIVRELMIYIDRAIELQKENK